MTETTTILGSHNSMTGEKPCNIFARLFPLFCRCQRKTLEEQTKAHVTCFDIRLWMGRDMEWHYGHGLAEYRLRNMNPRFSKDPTTVVNYIRNLHKRKEEPLFIRLILERQGNGGEWHFTTLCKELERRFPDICFFEGRDKKSWRQLYHFAAEDTMPTVAEFHASVKGKGLLKISPWLFWKKHGEDHYLEEGVINLVDFV